MSGAPPPPQPSADAASAEQEQQQQQPPVPLPPPPPPPGTEPVTAAPAATAATTTTEAGGEASAAAAPALDLERLRPDLEQQHQQHFHWFSELERARCRRAEFEACLAFAASLLPHHLSCGSGREEGGDDDDRQRARRSIDVSKYPLGVQEAWRALSRLSGEGGIAGVPQTEAGTTSLLAHRAAVTAANSSAAVTLGKGGGDNKTTGYGQYTVALIRDCLAASLKRASALASELAVVDDRGGNDDQSRRLPPPIREWWTSLKSQQQSQQSQQQQQQQQEKDDDNNSPALSAFDSRLRSLQRYHARVDVDRRKNSTASAASVAAGGVSGRKRPYSDVVQEDYDLVSAIVEPVAANLRQQLETQEEGVLGKYLDLRPVYEYANRHLKGMVPAAVQPEEGGGVGSATANSGATTTSYLDFLNMLLKKDSGLGGTSEEYRLKHRKRYVRFLRQLEQNLADFLSTTSPFLNIDKEVAEPAVLDLRREWERTGGYEPIWRAIPSEAPMADLIAITTESNNNDEKKDGPKDEEEEDEDDGEGAAGADNKLHSIDLSEYESADDLSQKVDGSVLKTELARLGLKCGGTVPDRARRLWIIRDKPNRDDWPQKILAKKKRPSKPPAAAASATANNSESGTGGFGGEPRVLIAKRQAIVSAMLQYVQPTLELTARRAERRQTQTEKEQERELYEDLYQGMDNVLHKKKKKKSEGDDTDTDDEDDEDAPIYNPKNVPLDWDGKPIPYWLFKLHGLNHYYKCEICGGESYRGRRNFETHFADTKHAIGMKSLGIPNTKHFHGVTSIQDAIDLYKSLEGKLSQKQFDSTTQEEYEDSHGNVLTRTAYEDLARQGLL